MTLVLMLLISETLFFVIATDINCDCNNESENIFQTLAEELQQAVEADAALSREFQQFLLSFFSFVSSILLADPPVSIKLHNFAETLKYLPSVQDVPDAFSQEWEKIIRNPIPKVNTAPKKLQQIGPPDKILVKKLQFLGVENPFAVAKHLQHEGVILVGPSLAEKMQQAKINDEDMPKKLQEAGVADPKTVARKLQHAGVISSDKNLTKKLQQSKIIDERTAHKLQQNLDPTSTKKLHSSKHKNIYHIGMSDASLVKKLQEAGVKNPTSVANKLQQLGIIIDLDGFVEKLLDDSIIDEKIAEKIRNDISYGSVDNESASNGPKNILPSYGEDEEDAIQSWMEKEKILKKNKKKSKNKKRFKGFSDNDSLENGDIERVLEQVGIENPEKVAQQLKLSGVNTVSTDPVLGKKLKQSRIIDRTLVNKLKQVGVGNALAVADKLCEAGVVSKNLIKKLQADRTYNDICRVHNIPNCPVG